MSEEDAKTENINEQFEYIEEPNIEFTKELLKKNYDCYHMQYKGYLANHLSHGLVALCFLGAPKEKIQDYYNKYIQKLEKKPAKTGIELSKDNYKEYAGKPEYYCDFLDFFAKQIRGEGKEKVLETYLPFLSSGVVGGAFHGIIQLGYALEKDIGDVDQISCGLAFALMVHHDVGKLTESNLKEIPPLETVTQILENLRHSKAFYDINNQKDWQRPVFIHKMKAIQNNDVCFDEITKYDLNVVDSPQNMKKMMDAIMRVAYMIGLDNFFIIHLVTSMRAIKAAYLSVNKEINCSLLNYFWRCALLSYVSLGCPPLQKDRPLDEKEFDWDSLIKDLFSRDVDTHIIKLVFVAREENLDVRNSEISSDNDENFYFNFAKKASQVKEWIF